MAPAMHTEMWEHPATVANVETLRSRGVTVVEPASGRLTGTDTGPGRLPEPEEILTAALSAVRAPGDLAGRHVVVSAGGTREPIDPVRFLGNRSSGRQGVELARAATARGAVVTLVAANVELPVHPSDVGQIVRVGSALELETAVRDAARDADVVVMAAAVADFRPARTPETKIKKVAGQAPAAIELVENPDILAGLARDRARAGQIVVGFAAETGDENGSVIDHGRAKARRKGADLLAVNEVGAHQGFGVADNTVTIVDPDGVVVGHSSGTKRDVADGIWDAVVGLLPPA